MKNLTPHVVRVINPDGSLLVEIEPCGQVARCAVKSTQTGTIDVNGTQVPVCSTVFGAVEGLPAEDAGSFTVGLPPKETYLVSLVVRQALPDRPDLFSPGELKRDSAGQPIGCIGLVGNKR